MPTTALSVGTSAKQVANISKADEYLDIFIQNLSVNNIYIGSDATVTTATGIKLTAGSAWSNDQRGEPVWVIADAVTSDIRAQYHTYRERNRVRV